MGLWIYLPVAGVSVSVPLVAGLGLAVGFLSGLLGVGGGFLLTPLLMMIGIPATVAAASDANQIVAASASGAYAHARAGTVDFKMGLLLVIGGFAGGTGGVQIVKVLKAAGNADFVIVMVYIVMLGGVGSYMLWDSIRELRGRKGRAPTEGGRAPRPSPSGGWSRHLPFPLHFARSGVTFSALVPLVLGAIVGILAAIMGVGGGFIMVPVMVYLLRMPMHVVVGTSLFQICLTCMNVTVQQAATNHTVDIFLALILLVGSTIGAQLGSRAGRRLRADQLKVLMAVLVLITMAKMLWGVLVTPDVLVGLAGGH